MAIGKMRSQTEETKETEETERPGARSQRLGTDERAPARALLVTVIFDGSVIAARYLDGRRARRGFVLGSGAGVDLACGDELLPAARHALVRWRRGRFELALPDGLTGSYRERGVAVPLGALQRRGLLIPAEGEPGVSRLELSAAAELEVTLGLLRIAIAAAAPSPRLPKAPLGLGPALGPLLGPVAVLSLLAVMTGALIAALPPAPVPLLRLHAVSPLHIARLVLQRPQPAAPRPGEAEVGLRVLLQQIAPHAGRAAGPPRPQNRPDAATQPVALTPRALTPRALIEALTADPVLDAETTAALDELQPGAPAGAGPGLGVGAGGSDDPVAGTGIERAARTGGRGEGQLAPSSRSSGLAGLSATCGELPCTGFDHIGQYGAGRVSRQGARPPARIEVTDGITLVCGRLPGPPRPCAGHELIRRIVRSHENEVRFCYERALLTDPTLAGRVRIRFSLDAAGMVSRSELADTTLPGREVGACIAEAFRRWQFPVGGGEVEVSYPFQLTSE